jgi:DNA-directed RNA polymerase specialized sigma24 family protein
MELTAECTREDGWWVVRVPEIRGLFTQVRRLDQVEEWVLDAASMLDNQPAEGYTVTVVPLLPDNTTELIAAARTNRARLREVEAQAAQSSRLAITQLRGKGLPVRDVATLMGISPQRVSALLATHKS